MKGSVAVGSGGGGETKLVLKGKRCWTGVT